jgi:hypothetical protein
VELLMNWESVIISIFTSSFVTLIISTFIKGGIGHFYNKKLENFKNDLSLAAEERKLDFQRRIHDFSLYSTQRHQVYPEIYKLLINAFANIRFSRYCPVPFDNEMRKRALIGILRDNKYSEEQIEKYLIMWKESPMSLFNFFNGKFIQKDIEEVNKSINLLFEYFNLNELFLSDDLSKLVDETIGNLTMLNAELPYMLFYEDPKDIEITIRLFNEIDDQIQEIKKIIKKELSIGDYLNK